MTPLKKGRERRQVQKHFPSLGYIQGRGVKVKLCMNAKHVFVLTHLLYSVPNHLREAVKTPQSAI